MRLKHYDYSQAGFYFITLCVDNRESLFGEIIDDQMILNAAGAMIEREWQALKNRFPQIEPHEYIVMPNHFHAILSLQTIPRHVGAPLVGALATQTTTKTLSKIIGAFKSITTVEYLREVKKSHWQSFDGKLWQRNFWEHVIRNEQSCNEIAQYIINNPQHWLVDTLKPTSAP